MGFRYISAYTCDKGECGKEELVRKSESLALLVKDQELVDMPKGWSKIHTHSFSGYLCPLHSFDMAEITYGQGE